jgi:uncharacterized protein
MNILKKLFAVAIMGFSLNSYALTDDESMAFTTALSDGDMKVVQKIIKDDPKAVNEKSFGWTPLQMAANKNQIEVVKYLMSKGADLNYLHPIAQHTAFHLAAFNGYTEMMKALAKGGVDINVKLKGDVSLIRYFRDEGGENMVTFLKELGVKDDGCLEDKCF